MNSITPQLDDAIDLVRAFPDTVFILNHFGGPVGIGPYAGRRWANSAPRPAACPMNHIARRGAPAPGADLAHQTIQPDRKVL